MRQLAGVFFFAWLVLMQSGFADGSAVGGLPDTKRAVEIDTTERNPYTKQSVPKVEISEEKPSEATEESRLTAILNKLEVTGRTKSENGWRVLMGDLILEPGRELPPLLDGQTIFINVVAIYDTMIEFEWIFPAAEVEPKRTFIPVRLRPAVASVPPGAGTATPIVITRTTESPPPNAPPDSM